MQVKTNGFSLKVRSCAVDDALRYFITPTDCMTRSGMFKGHEPLTL